MAAIWSHAGILFIGWLMRFFTDSLVNVQRNAVSTAAAMRTCFIHIGADCHSLLLFPRASVRCCSESSSKIRDSTRKIPCRVFLSPVCPVNHLLLCCLHVLSPLGIFLFFVISLDALSPISFVSPYPLNSLRKKTVEQLFILLLFEKNAFILLPLTQHRASSLPRHVASSLRFCTYCSSISK